MALSTGTRLGQYEILGMLGAGGMGEVYRARDVKLGRDVAIKTLPDVAAADPERLSRFAREAQLLAALNHPHIAQIYGFEESPSGRYLVLELVDGESLAERLRRDGRLSTAEALHVAGQIVDALDAAHDKGIVHRDLKPGNVMLTADGQAKVLDFGLARATEDTVSASVSNSPTISFAATQAGVILGTAAYMSPEQAKGRAADKRSDVWAFGCVLYEMLAGRRAFVGEDVSDTIAAILRGEPDWSAIPTNVPPHVTAIIRRCLARDRKARIPDMSVVRYLLAQPAAPAIEDPAQRLSRSRLLAAAAAGLLAGAALTAAVWWAVARRASPPHAQSMRLSFVAGPHSIRRTSADREIAIAPDGSRIAYVAGTSSGTQLVVRVLDELEGATLPGTIGARAPFFSPDGRWIGFFATGELKKVPASGGPSVPICRYSGAPRGAAWLEAGTIIFTTDEITTGLLSVPAGGGEPTVLTTPEGPLDHFSPAPIQGRNAVLYVASALGQPDAARIGIFNVDTAEKRTLVPRGTQPEFAQSGHLVYANGSTLFAAPFDRDRLEVIGDAAPVETRVLNAAATGASNYALSRHGHLIVLAGDVTEHSRTLVWVDRKGREEPIPSPPRTYSYVRVSPDGTRLAFAARDQENDIWVWDLARKTQTRITYGPSLDSVPIWTRDGRRIVFQSAVDGPSNLYIQAADGTGKPERLTTSQYLQAANHVPDATTLLFAEVAAKTGTDIFSMPLDGKAPRKALVQTPYAEGLAIVSPNGRWMAYQSNDGREENVYVKPYPNVDGGRWHISPNGGRRPVWSPDGRELYYEELTTGAMVAVAVDTSGTFSAGQPVKIIEGGRYFGSAPGRSFDIAPDGRFVMVKEQNQSSSPQPATLTLVVNWFDELKQKVAPR